MLPAIILLEKLSIATVNCMRQATRSRRRFFREPLHRQAACC
jgi:hypothetical protein